MINFRFVNLPAGIFLKKEDVVDYLLKMASTEETDSKIRLEDAAKKIGEIGLTKLEKPVY